MRDGLSPAATRDERLQRIKTKRDGLYSEREDVKARRDANPDDEGHAERLRRIDAGIANLDDEERDTLVAIGEESLRRDAIKRAAQDPAAREAGFAMPSTAPRQTTNPARDEALRTIESHSGVLRSAAADRLDRIVRTQDPMALEARYIAAIGDPAYFRACGKILADAQFGHLRFTPEEVAAVQRAVAIDAERGMVTGTDSAGGFAVPFTLDPSILLTSDGALNPIRDVARVITITTKEWKGVSSAGVTASYDPEASEVSDDTPTLAQPSITTAMGRAFIPFSIELGQDWPGLQPELLRLISDGRDNLDAVKFLTGSGVDEPAGVLTGLSTTQRVQTAGVAAFDLDDVYLLKQALPARFMPRAASAANPSTFDAIYRFVGGSSSEPSALPTREGPMLGRPKVEWSTMATGAATGTKLMVYGDWTEGFTIADRLGMTFEPIQTLFGANRRPTGERGLFAYWRSGSKVVNPNALRYLEVK